MTEILIRGGSSKYKDKTGERIYFPKDNKPYFDKAFRRTFSSAREKAEFMNERKYVSTGDSDAKAKREKKEHYERKMDTKRR